MNWANLLIYLTLRLFFQGNFGLEDFDDTIRSLLCGSAVQGDTLPHQDAYQRWLKGLRQDYPNTLGNLLFDDFKQGLKTALEAFVQGLACDASETDLERYIVAWDAANADPSDTYNRGKDELGRAVKALIASLRHDAVHAWQTLLNKANPIFDVWGEPFKAKQNALREQMAEVVGGVIFERLQNATQQNLRAYRTQKLLRECEQRCLESVTYDPFRLDRTYLFDLLRQPGGENQFSLGGKPNNRTYNLPLMPLLCGDNIISNILPAKFLRLTDYQLFLLRQWAQGHFYNEYLEGWVAKPDPYRPYAAWVNKTGRDLDLGVLTNVLGGAFMPGGEIGWVMRNTAIYHEPFRIKANEAFASFRQTAAQANAHQDEVRDEDYVSYIGISLSQDNDFARSLEPGDLTKYMALPWQSDFNECSLDDINITFDDWNDIYPRSDGDTLLERESKVWETMWWPAHRPLQTLEVISMSDGRPSDQMMNWTRGIPQTNAGNLKMVSAWSELGFVVLNPYVAPESLNKPSPDYKYISVERTDQESI